MLDTKREWNIILDAVKRGFNDNASDRQQDAFAKVYEGKFPNVRGCPVTVDEMRTYVYLLIEFAYNNDIMW